MAQNLVKLSIYPVLILNIVIGVVMVFSTHTFILVTVNRLNQLGFFNNMNIGIFSGIQQVVSIVGIIGLAITMLIALPLIERYYAQSLEQGIYVKRVLQIIGIQLFYWGFIQVITPLIAGAGISLSIWLLLILCGACLIFIGSRVFQKQINASEIPIS